MVTIGEAFSPVDGIVYSASDVKVKIGDSIIAPVGALHLTERYVRIRSVYVWVPLPGIPVYEF